MKREKAATVTFECPKNSLQWLCEKEKKKRERERERERER